MIDELRYVLIAICIFFIVFIAFELWCLWSTDRVISKWFETKAENEIPASKDLARPGPFQSPWWPF